MRSLLGVVLDRLDARRAASASAPVPYAPRTARAGLASGLFGGDSGGDRATQLAAMGGSGTLHAIVTRLMTGTASPRWTLYRESTSGLDGDRVVVPRHAAVDLWARPNPQRHKSTQQLVECVQQHVDLTGEGWIVIARSPSSSLPLELWPVRPDRMEPVQDPDDFVVGYIYRGPSGEEVPLEVTDVLRIIVPHPLDPYRGMGAVQSIMVDLDSSRMSAEWNRNFFRNSAEPGGILEVDRRLSDDEFNEMVTRWREQHQGVANSHRVAVIEQGKWVDRKYTMRDMQFAELRGVSRDVIREAFGVSKFVLGDVDDVNRATAGAAMTLHARADLVPRLDRWRGMLNHDLMPLYGPGSAGLTWDYETPVPEDEEREDAERTSKAQAAAVYIESGWEPDSVKEALDLPAALRWKGTTAASGSRVTASWGTATASLLQRQAPLSILAAEIPPDIAQVQADWETARTQLAQDLQEQQDMQADELAATVATLAAAGIIAGLGLLTITSTATTASLIAEAMAGMATVAARRVAEYAADHDVDITPPVYTSATFEQAAQATADLSARRLATSAGGEALRLSGYGLTPEELAERVAKHLADLSDSPTTRTAGGALTWAQNYGRLAAMQAGQPATWVATEVLDTNTCKPCRDIDGTVFATLTAAQDAYGGGGYHQCLGRDRCRGTVRPIWT